jgi:hypothetical protein
MAIFSDNRTTARQNWQKVFLHSLEFFAGMLYRGRAVSESQ